MSGLGIIRTLVVFAGVAATSSGILAAEAKKSEQAERQPDQIEAILRECAEGSRKLQDLYTDDNAPLRRRIVSYYETNTSRMPVRHTLVVGACMGKDGDFQRAAELAESYVAVYSNDWRGWQMLGSASYMLDRNERAFSAYKKAVALGEDTCYAPLAVVALDLNRLDAVREILPQLLRIKNSEEPPKFVKLEIVAALSVYAQRAHSKEVFLKALEGLKVEDILSRDDIAAAVVKACQEFKAAEVQDICQKVDDAMRRKRSAQPK